MNKKIDRLLIITSEPPDAKNANRIWINQILNKLNNHIFWFSTKGPYDKKNQIYKKITYTSGILSKRPNRPSLKFIKKWLDYEIFSLYNGYLIKKLCEKKRIDMIWIIAESLSVPVGLAAMKFTSNNTLLSVLDDYETSGYYWEKNILLSKSRYLNQFKKIILNADKCSVIGESMQTYYKKKYNISAQILYPSFSFDKTKIKRRYNSKFEISLAVIGSIYEYLNKEWYLLLSSIKKINARGPLKIRLLHIGKKVPITSSKFSFFEEKGWVGDKQLDRMLYDFDAFIVIQSFSNKKYIETKTSFPLKVSTYLQSRKPIIALCPSYSSVSNFIKKYKCGVVCNNLDDISLSSMIENLLSYDMDYDNCIKAIKDLNHLFDEKNFKQSIKGFFDF